jgi:hypothetical protein
MRFGLTDLLFVIACNGVGIGVGLNLASGIPSPVRIVAALLVGLCVYLVLVYPFYRGFRLVPLVLPRCPCCRNNRDSFQILGGPWPRINLRCSKCEGEFVVWLNGKPGARETWAKPVLALKWPYAYGIYKRENNPAPNAAPDHGPTTPPCDSGGTVGRRAVDEP